MFEKNRCERWLSGGGEKNLEEDDVLGEETYGDDWPESMQTLRSEMGVLLEKSTEAARFGL